MENIIMTEGVSNQFKSHLQTTFDYLDNCNNAIDKCKLLSSLGIVNNNNKLKEIVKEQKGIISKLLNNVAVYEKSVIDIDSQHAKDLTEIEEENPDVSPKDTPPTNDEGVQLQEESDTSIQEITNDEGVKNTNVFGGSGNNTSNNTNPSNIHNFTTTPSYSTPTNEQPTNTNNDYYEFSTQLEAMIEAGDVFANTEYNLTSYTNFLLYKYHIKDDKIAQDIYMALINYGKNYYQNNNGLNPILKQDETTIIMEIYNILKEKENFNINNYPIFKNLDITQA